MAKKRTEEIEHDAIDKLLGFAIMILMAIALVCILVYFEGSLTKFVFDHLHPMED